ncbi:hypothetical protein DT23_03990 [Thioclava indica]|uniref:Uncharacterized protein n=1 Tax=Thioclava indica TaxID=1353528 RepID=A0A074JTP3_9RHOB|nr:hypothetical protein DT23_03990 [Thioclava indica]
MVHIIQITPKDRADRNGRSGADHVPASITLFTLPL